MPARTGGPTPCGHLWRPQSTGDACTVLADVVHRVLITGAARPAMPRARHHGQTQAHDLIDGHPTARQLPPAMPVPLVAGSARFSRHSFTWPVHCLCCA
jgi:hypothetical protein